MKPNFTGMATRYNVKCDDGRTIAPDAFSHNHGKKVPVIWNHDYSSPSNVIGYGILSHSNEGMGVEVYLNDNVQAMNVENSLKHGVPLELSVTANRLMERNRLVHKGDIREVSVVVGGANPGAFINPTSISHAFNDEGDMEDAEAIIYMGQCDLEFQHAMSTKKVDDDIKVGDVWNKMSTEKQGAIMDIVESIVYGSMSHASGTLDDVFKSMTDEEIIAGLAIANEAVKKIEPEEGELQHGGLDMNTHNVFTQGSEAENTFDVNAAHKELMQFAKQRGGKLSHSIEFIQNSETDDNNTLKHGMTNIESMFPEYDFIKSAPDIIKDDQKWVEKVLGGTGKSPFKRCKSMHINITKEEARARGYIKGTEKVDQQYEILTRTSDPQTVVTKQSFDRDDILDIEESFDAFTIVKGTMRTKAREEVAAAILIGDGRDIDAPDKIKPDRIRPIYGDDPMYTIYSQLELPANTTNSAKAEAVMDAAVMAFEEYKGAGSAVAFVSQRMLSSMRLVKDGFGKIMYTTIDQIANRLGVDEIITVPQFTRAKRVVDTKTYSLQCLIINMKDYNVGQDRKSGSKMFDHFDIDYNKEKFLHEERLSGMNATAYSAIAIELLESEG